MKGLLVTYEGRKEKQAVRDCNNILNSVIDELYPPTSESTTEIQASIPNEIRNLKQSKLLRNVETGCNGVVFLRINPNHPRYKDFDVVQIVNHIFDKKTPQSLYIARIIPVLATCDAGSLQQFQKICESVLPSKLKSGYGLYRETWKLDCKQRNNSGVQRQDIVEAVMSSLPENTTLDENSTNLILIHINRVTITQKLLCLSVLPEYEKYEDYRLRRFLKKSGIIVDI